MSLPKPAPNKGVQVTSIGRVEETVASCAHEKKTKPCAVFIGSHKSLLSASAHTQTGPQSGQLSSSAASQGTGWRLNLQRTLCGIAKVSIVAQTLN